MNWDRPDGPHVPHVRPWHGQLPEPDGVACWPLGLLNEQATYCFQIYDIDEDGFVSKEDMFQLLKTSLRPAKGINYRAHTERHTPSPTLPQITQGKGEDGQAVVEKG